MEDYFVLIIWLIIIFAIIRSNKKDKGRNKKERIYKSVTYEETITKDGQTTNIKRTYTDGDLEQQIPEVEDMVSEKIFDEKSLLEEQRQLEQMNEFFEKTNNINNNRHSSLYQDVEKEIIKVDHTFSKEIFLNNAKEMFLKYQNAITQNNIQEIKEFATDGFAKLIQNRIDYNERNNISVIVKGMHIYNAYLYAFNKSTESQVITVKLKAEMKTYEKDNKTQVIIKGNEYARLDIDYEMQFERETKGTICQSCGAPVDMKDLSKCTYCGSLIEVKDNEWKLNYINVMKY